jgi:hypothetical protein
MAPGWDPPWPRGALLGRHGRPDRRGFGCGRGCGIPSRRAARFISIPGGIHLGLRLGQPAGILGLQVAFRGGLADWQVLGAGGPGTCHEIGGRPRLATDADGDSRVLDEVGFAAAREGHRQTEPHIQAQSANYLH